MIIKPKIRGNFFTNAHPYGCEAFVKNQIEEAKQLPSFDGPKNVLVIGGSSGYGLSSRIALAFAAGANTVNVSFESPPKGKRTGSAGWWNNIFFQRHAKATGNVHKDFIGDAFLRSIKVDVADYLKTKLGKIDLLVYSLAAPSRTNETTGERVQSSLKTVGEPVEGHTVDLANRRLTSVRVEPATKQEIEDTVYVMGGDDWHQWVEVLRKSDLLAEGFKTIAYTYIGGETTRPIYRDGSIGRAKVHLEQTARAMQDTLSRTLGGEALVSSSKAVATKASVFIPQMPVYGACLYDVMIRRGTHETILEHKHRLFYDMVYGDKRIKDEAGRIRLDHREMEPDVQDETLRLMRGADEKGLFTLPGMNAFIDELYALNGFGFEHIDYDKPVDFDALASMKPE